MDFSVNHIVLGMYLWLFFFFFTSRENILYAEIGQIILIKS